MTTYLKLTNKTANHNGLQLVEGLNTDPIPFCPSGDCNPGGIYFTTSDYLHIWLTYKKDLEIVWEVEIPKDAKVYHEGNKSKADKLILKNPMSIKKYLKSSNVPLNSDVVEWAVMNGHLNFLKYLHNRMSNPDGNGFLPWYQHTCGLAAAHGQLNCLKYLHENGCPWNEYTCERAAANGHLDCLKYAHDHGCPFNRSTRYSAEYNGHLDCVEYIQNHMKSIAVKEQDENKAKALYQICKTPVMGTWF